MTEFDVDDIFVARYQAHIVGSREDQELWIPAEELADFNDKILGPLLVAGRYYGESFSGTIDPATNLPLSVLAANKFK